MKPQRLVLIGGAFILLVFLALSIWNQRNQLVATRAARQTLPDLALLTTEKQPVSLQRFSSDSLILIWFDPSCGNCELLAREFKAHDALFRNHSLLWVSTGETAELLRFSQNHPASNYTYLLDPAGVLPDTLGLKATPSILVFHRNKLFTQFTGAVNPHLLLPQP